MTPKPISDSRGGNLRQQVRKVAGTDETQDLKALSPKEARRLVHELRVYQVELETQNEELRRAQGELDAARTKYFDLYDLAPVGYLTVNKNGLIMEANLTCANLLGVARATLKKQPLTRFIFREDQDSYYHHRRALVETGEPQVCEMRMLHRDGGHFWALLEETLAKDAESGESMVWAVISDITARKRAEEALLESEQGVRRLNEHILNMVMVLSHDIRGPIVTIASILKLMVRGAYGKLDQKLADMIRDLTTVCVGLLGTTEDFLGKASIVKASIEMESETLDLLNDVIDPLLEEFRHDIARCEITMDDQLSGLPAGSMTINASTTWLKAVYRNLFSNAIKYGGQGSTISFGIEESESHWRLNVRNSGEPVPEKDRKKLFAKFGRIKTSNGPVPDGVGLGLSLAKEIIQAHGGEIWYEALSDGSNFVFTIPREKAG